MILSRKDGGLNMLKDIKDAIAGGCKSFAEVQEKTGAGTVCGACIDDVETLVNKLLSEN